jgi:hypothetical protein
LVVQVIVALVAVIDDAVTPERVNGVPSENVAVWEEPFSVAVTVAVWSESNVPAVTVNVAEVALAATLTDDGTVKTLDALLEIVTTVLLVEVLDRAIVQVVLAFDDKLFAVHCREETTGRVVTEDAPVTVSSSMMSSEALYPP